MDTQAMEAPTISGELIMSEEKNLILATKVFAVENRAKSWLYMLSTLAILLIGFTATFYANHLFLKSALSIITGFVIVRMFVIYHDYLHKAILQNSVISNIIFTIFGLYILAPKSIWKRSHDYHHQQNSKLFTSSIGSFPIVTKKKFLSFSKLEQRFYLFVRHPLTISLGYIFAFLYGMCIQSLINNPKKHWDSVISLVVHFGIGFWIFHQFGLSNFLFVILIPSMIASAIGAYLFYAQHNFTDAKFEDKEGWTYMKAALNSSSYMKLGKLMNWFTANIGFHHIHHANHRIPFYNLPLVYAKMPEFQNPGLTSLHPLEIVRCVRLKVWDPEKGKMIGLKDIYSK